MHNSPRESIWFLVGFSSVDLLFRWLNRNHLNRRSRQSCTKSNSLKGDQKPEMPPYWQMINDKIKCLGQKHVCLKTQKSNRFSYFCKRSWSKYKTNLNFSKKNAFKKIFLMKNIGKVFMILRGYLYKNSNFSLCNM